MKNGNNYEVAGVVSFGFDCGKKNKPGVYADVFGVYYGCETV